MSDFKTVSTLSIFNLEAIELNIVPENYGITDAEEEILHIISGEIMYCGLLTDAKIIVTEKQMDEIFSLQNIKIHKIVDYVIYIHSLTQENRKHYNNLNKQVEYLSTENFDDDDEDDLEIFRLL